MQWPKLSNPTQALSKCISWHGATKNNVCVCMCAVLARSLLVIYIFLACFHYFPAMYVSSIFSLFVSSAWKSVVILLFLMQNEQLHCIVSCILATSIMYEEMIHLQIKLWNTSTRCNAFAVDQKHSIASNWNAFSAHLVLSISRNVTTKMARTPNNQLNDLTVSLKLFVNFITSVRFVCVFRTLSDNK